MKIKILILSPLFVALSLLTPGIFEGLRTGQPPQQGQPSRSNKNGESAKDKAIQQQEGKKPKDSLIGFHNYYLEMRGVIRQTPVDPTATLKGAVLDSVQIKVFADSNRLVAIHYSNKHGECRYKLPLNRQLKLEISKKGYVTKYIDVNSRIPPERKLAYIFPYDIDLFEEIKGLDASILKKPIAKVRYEIEKSNFEYDEAFTSSVNSDLKVLYKSYREKMRTPQDSTGKRRP
jgi:hypothetical protein